MIGRGDLQAEGIDEGRLAGVKAIHSLILTQYIKAAVGQSARLPKPQALSNSG